MPIYEYRCESCGVELEKIQKVSDPLLTDCPECGKPALQKLVSASGFRLKGTGWYETDFKTGKKKNLLGEGAAPASSDKSSTGKSSSSGDKPSGDGKASAAG